MRPAAGISFKRPSEMKEPERYIQYIPRTHDLYASHSPYRWAENTDAPWTPLTKPLNLCRVALASSAGIYLKCQTPFHTKDDTSIREIPKTASVSDFGVNHFGYRMDGAERDPNCVFPLETLRKLEGKGSSASWRRRPTHSWEAYTRRGVSVKSWRLNWWSGRWRQRLTSSTWCPRDRSAISP